MSDYKDNEPKAEPTRVIPPVNGGNQRHRRSAAARQPEAPASAEPGSNAPFSRVSGKINPVGGDVPVQGVPRNDGPRRIVHPADTNPNTPRRPVQAPGYAQREPVRSSLTASERRAPQKPQAGQDRERKTSRWPIILVVVVLVLALLVLGFMMIPEDDSTLGRLKQSVTGLFGGESKPTAPPARETVTISAATTTGTAPISVNFVIGTGSAVDNVRLTDGVGVPLEQNGAPVRQDNSGQTLWMLEIPFADAFEGDVRVQLLNGDNWEDTETTVALTIAASPAATATAEPAPTEEPMEELLIEDVGDVESMPVVYLFEASPSDGPAPLTVVFTIQTDPLVEDVRLVTESGVLESESIKWMDDEGMRWWTVTQVFQKPADEYVTIRLLVSDEWINVPEELEIYVYEPVSSEELTEAVQIPEQVTPGMVEASTVTIAPTEVPPAPTQNPLVMTEDNQMTVPTSAPSGETDKDAQDGIPADDQTESAGDDMTDEHIPDEIVEENLDESEVTEAPAGTAEPAATQGPSDADGTEETEVPARRLTVNAAKGAEPSLIKVAQIFGHNSTKRMKEYVRTEADIVDMGDTEHYTMRPFGILTFRGSSFRQNAAYGTVGSLTSMSVKWQVEAGSVKGTGKTVYYGIGRGSQPVIMRWAKDVRETTNMTEEKKATTSLKEVIISGEDGNIYFLDLTDGSKTREPIKLGYPMRGTPSLHTNGWPFMAVGQYARKMASGTGKIGMRFYNLLDQKEMGMIDGTDNKLKRPLSELSNFDTSPLIDAESDTMITAGSNGMLYLTKLDSSYRVLKQTVDGETVQSGEMRANPTSMVLTTQANKEAKNNTAVQSSLASYQNYVFYADKGGYLRCVDTSSLTVQWAVATGDAVEAAIALDLDEDGHLWLYTATTLQNRNRGDAVIRRYNAETGAEDWSVAVNVTKGKNNTPVAGAVASPVIGTGSLDDYVYFTLSNLSAAGAESVLGEKKAADGALICLEKRTGRVRWGYALDSYSYSSPVAVYDANGTGWIIQASRNGTLTLLEGATGSLVQSLDIEGIVNGSPAVYNSTLVIGTQGKGTSYIYGIELIGPKE